MTDTPEIPMKKCSKCGQEKPATREYFYINARKRDGLFSYCILCHKQAYADNRERKNAINRKSHARHRDERNAHMREYRDGHRDELKVKHQQYYLENKARIQQYRAENKDRLQVTARRYYEVHRDWYGEFNRQYHINHREEILKRKQMTGVDYRARYADKLRERHRRWRLKSPQYVRLAAAKRRARIRSLPNTFTYEDWLRCLEYWNNTCAVCGIEIFDGVNAEADHWIALTDPRPDNPGTVCDNMVCMCAFCNNSKHNKHAETWLLQRYGAEKAAEILTRITAYFASL